MFKELGAFIDHVGRATGRMIGQILLDKDDDDMDGMMGQILPEDVQGLPDVDYREDRVSVKIDDDE